MIPRSRVSGVPQRQLAVTYGGMVHAVEDTRRGSRDCQRMFVLEWPLHLWTMRKADDTLDRTSLSTQLRLSWQSYRHENNSQDPSGFLEI